MNKLICATLTLLTYTTHFAQKTPWPNYSVKVTRDAPKGYYFFQGIKIGGSVKPPCQMILDGQGAIVYFKVSDRGEWAGDFKLHPNGLMSYSSDQHHKAYLMDKDFNVVDSVGPKNGSNWDIHDFQILKNGHFLFLAFKIKTMDLSNYLLFNKKNTPGSDTAKVYISVIQELNAHKNLVYQWDSQNHYDLKDTDPYYLSKSTEADVAHLNSVQYYNNYILVSARNVNEVTKIKKSDSTVVWRMGGKRNQFKFTNDTTMFIGQHYAHYASDGNLILFDNGREGSPPHPATAKEYKLNENTLEATLVRSYVENPKVFSNGYGSAERIGKHNLLICYGRTDRSDVMFNVVNTSGAKLFEVTFEDSLKSYRIFYFPSLPRKLKRPAIHKTRKD